MSRNIVLIVLVLRRRLICRQPKSSHIFTIRLPNTHCIASKYCASVSLVIIFACLACPCDHLKGAFSSSFIFFSIKCFCLFSVLRIAHCIPIDRTSRTAASTSQEPSHLSDLVFLVPTFLAASTFLIGFSVDRCKSLLALKMSRITSVPYPSCQFDRKENGVHFCLRSVKDKHQSEENHPSSSVLAYIILHT